MELDFSEWLPDLPAYKNPGALLAKNCIPEAMSYRELRSLQSFASAISGQARGSFWLRSKSGTVFNFAGDAANLYKYNGAGAWSNINKPATTYTAGFWDFVNFKERVICTDGGNGPLQYFDCDTPSTTFLDLPGSPPRCEVLGVCRDFVLLGNYVIGSESESGGYAWSGFNNTELWNPSQATQSGRSRTRGIGGAVKRIVSGSVAYGFHESAIRQISYVGPPTIFRIDDVTVLHGTPAPRSVCWFRDMIYYYSQEGFYELDRTTGQLNAIGESKVDQWFTDNAAVNDITNMMGAVDRVNNLVFWAFRSSTSSVTYDRILIYNRARKRWAYAELSCEFIGEFASTGYNLDTIGAVLGGNIDSASIPVDSDAYAGGGVALLAFDPSHVSSTFAGPALTAEIDTAEFSADGNARSYTDGVVPIVESVTSPTTQVAPLTRDLIDGNPVLGSFVTKNAIGQCDMRVDARYLRFRVKISGGFTAAKSVKILNPRPRGRR